MKLLKLKPLWLLILASMMSFSKCENKQSFENKPPLKLGEVYYIETYDSKKEKVIELSLFIPIKSNLKEVVLDSVHFKKRQVKLDYINDTLVVGRIQTVLNNPKDIIMSNEPYAEYGNKLPRVKNKSPFPLEANECIVSYIHNNQIKYFKISNITKNNNE